MKTATAFMTTPGGLFSGTAKLSNFNEGDHPRNESGEFGAGEATDAATKHTAEKGSGADYHAKGEALHKAAAEANKKASSGNDFHGVMAENHEHLANWHAERAKESAGK